MEVLHGLARVDGGGEERWLEMGLQPEHGIKKRLNIFDIGINIFNLSYLNIINLSY